MNKYIILFMLAPMAFIGACSSIDSSLEPPKTCDDPAQVAAHANERKDWEQAASRVRVGMTRAEVEQILPRNSFMEGSDRDWFGTTSAGSYQVDGLRAWYYLSANFICKVHYSYSGKTRDLEDETVKFAEDQKLASPIKIVQIVRPPSDDGKLPWL